MNNKKKKLLTVVLIFTIVLAVTATTWCIFEYDKPEKPSLGPTPRPTDPPKPITCSEKTTHSDSGCKLLLHYDADNDGKISGAELNPVGKDLLDDKITGKEYNFLYRAYEYNGINKLCPGCYSP